MGNNNFTGQLSISEVPNNLAPAALPDRFDPALLITIQPVGVIFDTPAPLTFPNLDNLPAGSEVDIWSLDPEAGIFVVVGVGQVSNNGLTIETIRGGVRAADWHFMMPPAPNLANNPNDDLYDNGDNQCTAPSGSRSALATGELIEEHSLASYNSLNRQRSLRLIYNSSRANPQPIILGEPTISVRSAVPRRFSSQLSINDTPMGDAVYTSTDGLSESENETLRQARQFDASSLATGRYRYEMEFTSHFSRSSVSSSLTGNVLINNQSNSPFGSGWAIDGLSRLWTQGADVLLTQGDGSSLLFQLGLSEEGAFSGPSRLSTIDAPLILKTVDLNNDQNEDLIVADAETGAKLYLLFGDGNGGFSEVKELLSGVPSSGGPGGFETASAATGDFNSDGIIDIVSVNQSSNSLSIFLGLGSGDFLLPRKINSPRPSSIQIADFNLDGNDDIVVNGFNSSRGEIRVYRGIGDGTFSLAATPTDSNSKKPSALVVGDFNEDGMPDVAFQIGRDNNTKVIGVLLNNGAFSFSIRSFPIGGSRSYFYEPLNVADFNVDGHLDLVATTSDAGISILSGDGTGFFASRTFPVGTPPVALASVEIGDFNTDGIPDIVTTNPLDDSISILLGHGNGEFAPATNIPLGDWPVDVATGDFNKDGALDIAASSRFDRTVFVIYGLNTQKTEFISPPGDFSKLTKNENGTFTRTFKNGTRVEFNTTGLQTAIVDLNDNTTSFLYNANQQLEKIVDPIGKETVLSYINGKLSKITDPAQRVTQFQIDGNGDLQQITDPDQTIRQFSYDGAHRLKTQTSKHNFTTGYGYNFAGRFGSSNLPDGSSRTLIPSDKTALIDPASGLGTSSDPAPNIRANTAEASYTNGYNETIRYKTGKLNAVTQTIDPLNRTTQIEHNQHADPTIVQTPDGVQRDYGYDDQGNMLTLKDTITSSLVRSQVLGYHPVFNKITSITDSFQKTTQLEYNNNNGNLEKITTPLGRIVSFTHTARGLVETLTDTLGTVTALNYDPISGNVKTITRNPGANQRVTTILNHSPEGYIESIQDAENRIRSFVYDELGRVKEEILPDNRKVLYSYDDNGNLESLTPPDRPAHVFTYDTVDRLASYQPPTVTNGGNTTYEFDNNQQLDLVTRPDNKTLDFEYNAAGQLESLAIPRGSYGFEYDINSGQLAKITAPDNGTLTYGYSGFLPDRVQTTGEVSGRVNYAYDNNFRLQNIRVNDATPIVYDYDDDGLLRQVGNLVLTRNATTGLLDSTILGSVNDSYTYNDFAEPETYQATTGTTTLYQVTYVRDALGRIEQKTEIVNGITTIFDYAYDLAGRLEEVRRNNVISATYTYDDNGNRLTGPTTETGTYDAQDRLLTYNGATYSYTPNGELLTKTQGGQITQYDYDVLGNLIGVDLPNGTQIDYVIDGQNRRIGKKVGGVLQQGFLYQDQLNPVAELDGIGNVVKRFVYGSRRNVPDYMIQGGVTYRFVTDQLGSPRSVVNTATGVIAQQLDYDEFGNTVIVAGDPDFQPFGFVGGIYDRDTGLVRFGARDYDAEVGRWMAKDPILFQGGSVNLYTYALSDPLNFIDIDGKDVTIWVQPGNLVHAYFEVDTPDGGSISFDFGPRTVTRPLWSPGEVGVRNGNSLAEAAGIYEIITIHTTPEEDLQIISNFEDLENNPPNYNFVLLNCYTTPFFGAVVPAVPSLLSDIGDFIVSAMGPILPIHFGHK